MVAKGEGGGCGVHGEFAIRRCKLSHLQGTDNKALLYSTGNYIQSPRIAHDGKEYEKECIRVCVCVDTYITESLCRTAEIGTIL